MLARLRSLARGVWRRDAVEADLEDELRFHLERRQEDLVRAGVAPEKALRQATLEFGHGDSVKEACREARGLDVVDTIARDVRYACRLLRRSPGFACIAITTLALCIGANTAIFSVVDAVLFRPLPYPEPSRLAEVATIQQGPAGAEIETGQTGATWELVRDHATTLDSAAFSDAASRVHFTANGRTGHVAQQRVSARFFGVLGVAPLVGRPFTVDEDRPGGARVVVLGHALWERVFDKAPSALGQRVQLRGEPYTVVGVMPAGFTSTVAADLWTPLRPARSGEGGGENYSLVARLRRGITWAEADAQVGSLGEAVVRELRLPPPVTARVRIVPLQRGLTDSMRRPLLILMGGVFAVLLIGCLNLAGLLVARGIDRVPEIATRMAVGAGRGGVVRQLLTESLVLALVGGAGALAVAWVGVRWLQRVARDTYDIWQPLRLDARVLAAASGLLALTTVIFGIAPALSCTRLDLRSAIAEGGGRGGARSSNRWPRRLLVVAQVALGVVLLANAALLVRTFAFLANGKPGIDATNVTAATISLQDVRYNTAAKVTSLFDESLARIRALPGVQSAAATLNLPYQRWFNMPFRRAGERSAAMTVLSYVTPDYFAVLRIPLLRGRPFDAGDRASTQPVVIVDDAFGRTYFPGSDPLGTSIVFGGRTWSIVGVVGAIRQKGSFGNHPPLSAMPAAYIPVAQAADGFLVMAHTWFSPSYVVRTAGPQVGLQRELERAIAAVDPQLPVAAFRTIDVVRNQTLAPQRFQAILLAAFSLLAVLLAGVGIYGLVAKTVAERTRELGIRMALGATVRRAVGEVARPIALLAVAGAVAGTLGAAATSRLLRSQVWGVSAWDPLSLGGAVVALVAVAVTVSFGAAARVARVNPADTLRRE
jgi:predicted permease